jgi:prevent-host-death family protein
MYISAAEARGRLPELLRSLREGPVTITRRGEPVGVLLSPEEYQRLSRVRAYLDMLRLAAELRGTGLTARELVEASRQELEERL